MSDKETLQALLDRLMWMVEVQPGKKVPYLQGCHGNSEIKEIVPALESLFTRLLEERDQAVESLRQEYE